MKELGYVVSKMHNRCFVNALFCRVSEILANNTNTIIFWVYFIVEACNTMIINVFREIRLQSC